MEPEGRTNRSIAYVMIVGVVVAATLAGASVLYQLTERAHVHPGVPAGWESSLGTATDFAGFVLIAIVALQLFWGLRISPVPWQRYKTWHPRLGLAIAAVLAVHGVSATAHSLIGQIEPVPIVLDWIGAGLTVLVGVLIWSGYRLLRDPLGSVLARTSHSWVVAVLAITVTAHGLIGTYHTITG